MRGGPLSTGILRYETAGVGVSLLGFAAEKVVIGKHVGNLPVVPPVEIELYGVPKCYVCEVSERFRRYKV